MLLECEATGVREGTAKDSEAAEGPAQAGGSGADSGLHRPGVKLWV